MCWWVITFFVIFAVLDVSFAVNSFLNRSFFYIYPRQNPITSLSLISALATAHVQASNLRRPEQQQLHRTMNVNYVESMQAMN